MTITQRHIYTVCKLLFLFICAGDQVRTEPASRNQRVVGGKGQKRKRTKKDVVKVPRKRKRGKMCEC